MLRNVFCVVVAAVWTTVIFPCTVAAMVLTLNRSASIWVVRKWWAPVLLWAGGAKLHVKGTEHLRPNQPYIFVSNHQSTIDIPVLFMALPINCRFVAKKVLRYVPFLGWYMWLSRFVFIDRSNRRSAMRSLEVAAKEIQSGVSIIVFPEGTRSEDRRVLPFKTGSFILAERAQVPVIPVAIEGSGQLMPKNSWNITPGTIQVLLGAPVFPAAFEGDRAAFMAAVRQRIIEQNKALGGLGAAAT